MWQIYLNLAKYVKSELWKNVYKICQTWQHFLIDLAYVDRIWLIFQNFLQDLKNYAKFGRFCQIFLKICKFFINWLNSNFDSFAKLGKTFFTVTEWINNNLKKNPHFRITTSITLSKVDSYEKHIARKRRKSIFYRISYYHFYFQLW